MNRYRIIYLPAFDGYVAQKRSCIFWWKCIRSNKYDVANYGEAISPLSIARSYPTLYKCKTLAEARDVVNKNKELTKREGVVWEGD